MLVLSRQRDESIMIGDNVQVTIVDIRGDKVRLGIVAPTEISVHRKEVYDAIQRENRKAAGVTPADLDGAATDGRLASPRAAAPPLSPPPAASPAPPRGRG
jgi:carbon storage regulator